MRQLLALCAVVAAMLFAGIAVAQQVAPVPAPLPSFRQPALNLVGPSPEQQVQTPAMAPTTRTVTTTTITANPAAAAAAQVAVAAPPANPQPVILTAQVTEGLPMIAEGLTWRVYNTTVDASGQLTLAAQSTDAIARVELAPGVYVVHVAFGRAQVADSLTVVEGSNEKKVVLEAGGLRLNAAVVGDVPIPINQLRFDIFEAGSSEGDENLIQRGVAANDIVTVSSGTYHVVSHFGDVNAEVRADLRVEPGQLTDAVLYHKAQQLSFKLVSTSGGEAIADVEWTVKNSSSETIYTNIGAFPSTVLEEGDYVVLAKRGTDVFNRAFQVVAGQPREIEVLTTVY